MPAPEEIIDSLESIVTIYLSDIRHRERATFILCDTLIEMACKTKAHQHNHRFNTTCNFHDACNAPGVSLSQRGIGRRVIDRRNTRNDMQHGNAAVTVDSQLCADAILDAVKVINHCWKNTTINHFPVWLKCALRIILLYSSDGDPMQRQPFEDAMLAESWRGLGEKTVKFNERNIVPGRRAFWWLAVMEHTPLVENCLGTAGAP